MIKKVNLSSVLLVLLLTFSLTGQGLLPGIVLCIGEDDHIAVEFSHNGTNCFYSSPDSESVFSPLIFMKTSEKTDQKSCSDIPLVAASSDQPVLSAKHIIPQTKTLAYGGLLSLVPAYTEVSGENKFQKSPSFITSTFKSLRTVILLI